MEAVRHIDPQISTVSMVGGEESYGTRRAMVRAEHLHRAVPLRSFGDGMNRLFTVALSLVNAQEGILLIDEFENGLHYTAQLDAWRMIFRVAQQLDVQVFATTHSMDAIKGFQEAASESPEDGVHLRLTRWRDQTIQLLWGEEELGEAVRHGIEAR